MNLIRTAAVLGALALAGAPLQSQQRLPADSMELARKYTMWFYTGMADSLLAHMDSASRANMTKEQFEQAMLQVAARAGNEVSVIEEKFITRNGARQYWRAARMDILEEPFLLRWVITARGKIAGMGIGPLSEAPPVDP
jgi:hypothetical protein